MKIEVELLPFRFPNFIRVDLGEKKNDANDRAPGRSVGDLSDEQAEAYWDAMKTHWLQHVRSKRVLG